MCIQYSLKYTVIHQNSTHKYHCFTAVKETEEISTRKTNEDVNNNRGRIDKHFCGQR